MIDIQARFEQSAAFRALPLRMKERKADDGFAADYASFVVAAMYRHWRDAYTAGWNAALAELDRLDGAERLGNGG